jgi:cell division septal protein FtsQ
MTLFGATEKVEERVLRPRQHGEASRRGFFHRRRNRRITVSSPSVARAAIWIGRALRGVARRGVVVGQVLAALSVLAAGAFAGDRAIRHVIASPRFAVREVRVGATLHVRRDDVLALAGVARGDRLLSIDTDAVAARVASHPWVASARVRRELPSALAIDVTERRAAAAVLLGGLYLIDEAGRPFKRATLDEADGLVLLTGLTREHYAGLRAASEAAFREALAILNEYRSGDPGVAVAPGAPGASLRSGEGGRFGRRAARPALSEIRIDPRYGFSLLLYDGGGEIMLGRADYADKLARLDQILAAMGGRSVTTLRVVHLDGPNRERVPVRLDDAGA